MIRGLIYIYIRLRRKSFKWGRMVSRQSRHPRRDVSSGSKACPALTSKVRRPSCAGTCVTGPKKHKQNQ